MELIRAYWYRHPGEFEAAKNIAEAKLGKLKGWWVTQDGVKLKPYMMRDSHLMNAIGVIEKRAKGMPLRKVAIKILQGSSLLDFEGNEYDIARMLVIKETYLDMIEEAIERGLIANE
jgi:hypothetical protein